MSSIFKAYDIRGIYPTEINEEIAEKIGHAFVVYLNQIPLLGGEGGGEVATIKPIVVGRDCRLSSPTIAEAVIRGLRMQGADVIDCGMVSTDLFYFACATEGKPGIMVTASHNPKVYSGLKLVKEIPWMIGGGQGMEDIQALVEAASFPQSTREGLLQKKEYIGAYRDRVLSFIDPTSVKPLTVVMDAGNGMVGPLIEVVFKGLPIKIIPLFFEPDGHFPNRGPDPLRPENRAALEDAVQQHHADVGFAFDADADRCFVVDNTGESIPADFVTALIGEEFAARYPGAPMIYDVRASWVVRDRLEKVGARPLMNRVGQTYIKKRMAETNAVFGGELSGHYYFRDFFQVDSALITSLVMIAYLSRHEQSLADILAPIRAAYHVSGEINSEVHDVPAVFARLKERYQDGKQSELDGLSVDYDRWHFNVRPSNTEPLLRLNLEAKSKEMMEQKRDEVLRIIRS
ncbi:phosphomannomutase/phosphoglucomutase [Candidatus Uhrbacteria bacterium]|nr:phosphomannomutase/phosphoglucomutase [Candidatus Uhrbacteria bacterium]